MAEASNLFDKSGGASSGNKQDAVNGAAMTVMKLLVQSKFSGAIGGGNSGGLGSLMGLVSFGYRSFGIVGLTGSNRHRSLCERQRVQSICAIRVRYNVESRPDIVHSRWAYICRPNCDRDIFGGLGDSTSLSGPKTTWHLCAAHHHHHRLDWRRLSSLYHGHYSVVRGKSFITSTCLCSL